MFKASKCLPKHKKLLEAVTYKVQRVSYLHVCKNPLQLNGKRLLSIYNHQTSSRYFIKPISSVRLLSTDKLDEKINAAADSTTPNQPVINETAKSSDNKTPLNATSNETTANTSTSELTVPQDTVKSDNVLVDFPIPDPPTPPVPGQSTALSEIPFEQLGLGGWSPAGMIQQCFEFFHVQLGLPWWECIMLGTVIVRMALFPLVIMSQRSSARLANNQPQFQELQEKVNRARQRGDHIEAARYTQDLLMFMKEKNVNPLKQMLIPLIQAPVFISFFWGLREMANIPVKSMQYGGLFWFTDLTVPDQYYLLPIITSVTMLTAIEVGADSSRMTNQNHFLVKYILRFIPLVIFPFTINFPGAILFYWACSNVFSLIQVGLFKIPKVRDFFKIERRIIHSQEKLIFKPKGFIQSVKDWWKESRLQSEHMNRPRKNKMSFTAAGRGAVPKTYKYNPTLPRPESSSAAAVQAQKRTD